MTQKILAGRTDGPDPHGDLLRVRVDQVILARETHRVFEEATAQGMKKAAVETAVAYDTRCVTNSEEARPPQHAAWDGLNHGILVARPGIGFPAPVHLERFASPARLALTDEPRLASVGGASMLTLTTSPSQLATALSQGYVLVRPPRSVQVLLSGRVRPFVCVRDVALELIRRDLASVVRRIDEEQQAPVVLEFAGPSARLLSVPERAVLTALAPQLGAAAAIFISDEKTEVYLRDQRRSKAHRGLAPDAGAPCDDVVSIDLSVVDPLVMDRDGMVKHVRELADTPVAQVILGGDSGAALRDLLAAAALLKSKRVPPGLDLLLSPPSRQALEVLAQAGALADLIATGARLLEPDHRVVTGELYPPPPGGLSLRTFDQEPGLAAGKRFVVASAETIAFAVAGGKIGDPRGFKRPVRVTVPRALPTDDVLIVRKGKGKPKLEQGRTDITPPPPPPRTWGHGTTLQLVPGHRELTAPSAMVIESLDEVRWVARRAADLTPNLRAVIAPHIPSGTVPVFAGLGILALTGDEKAIASLRRQDSVGLPPSDKWNGEGITANAGDEQVKLSWLAVGAEREWTTAGAVFADKDRR